MTGTQLSTKLPKDAGKRIVWVDLEMTGLNVETDHILEIACLVTDAQLNLIAKGPNLIINQPDEILNNMGAWCIAQHGEVLKMCSRLLTFNTLILATFVSVYSWKIFYIIFTELRSLKNLYPEPKTI